MKSVLVTERSQSRVVLLHFGYFSFIQILINIDGYKKWVRKCRKQATYRHNLEILCQGREDNPLHTDAFNELIENLKEKKYNME